MSESWLEVTFVINNNKSDLEEISDALENIGALSSSFEANVKTKDDIDCELMPGENPMWPELKVVSLFDKESNISEINDRISSTLRNVNTDTIQAKIILDTDWQENFRQEFKPKQFGKIWVYPSWHELPDDKEKIMILDPGLAFGTGSHPTTSLCLEWLSNQKLTDTTVIDFGCGSGILAIGACLLGAKTVYAIDHDEQALVSTRQNAETNNINETQLITLHSSDITSIDIKADYLVANILFEPLIKLKDTIISLTKDNANIAMSGILLEQEEELKNLYSNDLIDIEIERQDEWSRLSGKK